MKRSSRTSVLPNGRSSVLPSNRKSVTELPRNARAPESDEPASVPPLTMAPKRAAKPKRAPKRGKSGAGRAWLSRLSLLTGIIVVVSASIAVAWGLRRYLRTSPRFAVREIHVEGNARRTPTQVADKAGIENGRNIFTVSEDVAKDLLESDPWIESAEIKVELPNTVNISVVEREARALSIVDGELFLTDNAGNIFKKLGDNDPRDLPVVTGITVHDIGQDREAVTAQIRRALDLASDLEASKIAARYPLQELHLDGDGSVSATVGSDGVVLVFGQPPFRGKVDKAERILEELRYRKVQRAVLFLDNRAHPERVVVRLQTTAKEP